MAAKPPTNPAGPTRPQSGIPAVPETPPANLPIPPQPAGPDEEAVRARAYELWDAAGQPEGDGAGFWYEAERELGGK